MEGGHPLHGAHHRVAVRPAPERGSGVLDEQPGAGHDAVVDGEVVVHQGQGAGPVDDQGAGGGVDGVSVGHHRHGAPGVVQRLAERARVGGDRVVVVALHRGDGAGDTDAALEPMTRGLLVGQRAGARRQQLRRLVRRPGAGRHPDPEPGADGEVPLLDGRDARARPRAHRRHAALGEQTVQVR